MPVTGLALPRSSDELLDFVVLMNHSIPGEALRRGALISFFMNLFLRYGKKS
jgi:hypothetical protein